MKRPGCSDADAGWKMMIICQRFEAWACNFDWAARCWCGWRGRAGPQVPVGGILRKLVGWPGFGWAAGGYTHHTYSYWSFRVGICLTIVTIM